MNPPSRYAIRSVRHPATWILLATVATSANSPLLSRCAGGAPPAQAPNSPPIRFVVAERVLCQVQGHWQADYAFRLQADSSITLAPGDVAAKVEGWLSNSRVPVHATPRHSAILVDGATRSAATGEVIAAADEARRCRERLSIHLEAAPQPGEPAPPPTPNRTNTGTDPEPLAPVTIAPGGLLRVRLRLEHQHVLYGDYDPLLGRRELELKLGPTTYRDLLPLDREQYLAYPPNTWGEPDPERRDTRVFLSAPDSVHLEADLPGHQYFRFPERKVRYGTRMRLRFSYLIAPGTEGEFRARIAQYRDSPNSWINLSEGASDLQYRTVGRWVRVERIIRTEPEATILALDFRIVTPNAEIGEAWIDDVSLEPVDTAPAGP